MADRMRAHAAAHSEVNENEYNHGLDEPSADKTFPSSRPGGKSGHEFGNSD